MDIEADPICKLLKEKSVMRTQSRYRVYFQYAKDIMSGLERQLFNEDSFPSDG